MVQRSHGKSEKRRGWDSERPGHKGDAADFVPDAVSWAPDWAAGCDQCQYGVVGLPEAVYHIGVPLHIAEAMLLKRGDLVMCTCKAGQTKRAYLERQLAEIRDASVVYDREGAHWTKGCPAEYVPGAWWKQVIEAVSDAVPPIHWAGE